MILAYSLLFIAAIYVVAGEVSSAIIFDGFSWAENLVFDGLGNMYVAESVRGEIWQISLCEDGVKYCGKIYVEEGLHRVGGLRVSSDGKYLYAGVTMSDKTTGILKVPIPSTPGEYEVVARTQEQPNGLAFDEVNNVLYYTAEGDVMTDNGLVVGVHLNSGSQITVSDTFPAADGAWFDDATNLLFIGELYTMKVVVYNATDPFNVKMVKEYNGMSGGSKTDMMDEITLFDEVNLSSLGSTKLLGCDFTGKELRVFKLDGSGVSTIPVPAEVGELNQVTSVRWGKGPGFDSNSVYVTEGGGLTPHETGRRVIQFQLKR